MSKDEDPEMEKRLNHSFLIGQSVGLELGANDIARLSVEEFNNGHDTQAIFLRSLAKDFMAKAKKIHMEADEKFPI